MPFYGPTSKRGAVCALWMFDVEVAQRANRRNLITESRYTEDRRSMESNFFSWRGKKMSVFDKSVIKQENLSAMVDSYEASCRDIDQAFALLKLAGKRMESVYGRGFDCVYLVRYHNTAKEVKDQIKKEAWKTLLDRLEIKKIMSIEDLEKTYRSFEKIESIPEINIANLTEITIGLLENVPEYSKRLVEEVYKILMPGNNNYDKYKTNKKNARRFLGKKVILVWMVEIGYDGKYIVKYHAEEQLTAIDKVFYALDGNGIPGGYKSSLVDAINLTSIKDGIGETEYFRFWCYQNGNLHIEFKRHDLVDKLNQIAGNGIGLSD
jgi:hypothetical protein